MKTRAPWLNRTACLTLSVSFAWLAQPAEIILRPLPTNSPVLGQGLGRFHVGPGHWTIEGGVAASRLEVLLPKGADFDGDGRMDWAVASPNFLVDRSASGKVWLLSFASNGVPRIAWSWEAPRTMTRAARALAAGDFNGDGFPDLAVSVPSAGDLGGVLIFNGSPTNLSREATGRVGGTRPGGRFGAPLLARDVNRDGRDDLLVGAPSMDPGRSRLLLFLGGTNGLVSPAAWVLDGAADGRRMGGKFTLLDANGDGWLDLAVGLPTFSPSITMTNVGRVDLYPGGPGLFARVPAWSKVGDAPEVRMGLSLRSVGDLNKDGREDLAVESAGRESTAIYLGSVEGLGQTSVWTRVESGLADPSDDGLRGVGDVNGDGWMDVVTRGDKPNSGSTNTGEVRMFLGGPTGLAGEASWVARISDLRHGAAQRLGELGDLNGDGLMDFAVATPNAPGASGVLPRAGRIDVFLGRKEGYGAADVFPMDGINSHSPAQALAEATLALAKESTSPTPPGATMSADLPAGPEPQRHWWPWMGLAVLAGVGVTLGLWSRAQVRRASASAVKSERERLARDLHDGLGSGVHRLQRLAELSHHVEPSSDEARRLREDMARTAQELSGSLDRTVWAVKPENDTLDNLVTFLAAYVPSVLEPHGIECELDLPPALPAVVLHGDTRQSLFLAVNEALQNVVKHAQARQVWLRAVWGEPELEIVVEDNGAGVRAAAAGSRLLGGNGLDNQRERLTRLGGALVVGPRTGGGTRVCLRLPLKTGGHALATARAART